MRRAYIFLLIPIAAAAAILPLVRHGNSCGHDFDFHLVSWLDASAQIASGNLHPHWALSPAFEAGEPRFVFYPPLSWGIGAVFTLLLLHLPRIAPPIAFAAAPVLYIWLALTAAGTTMFALLRRYTTANAAGLLSAVYLTNPYALFTAYERSAFAELLAAAWLPLLLAAILPGQGPSVESDRGSADRLFSDRRYLLSSVRDRVNAPLLAIALALLWLTNAPAAVMGCYVTALIVGLRLALLYRRTRRFSSLFPLLVRSLSGVALGFGLAAFYVVPAAYEQRWVQIGMTNVPGMRITDNTLFHHTADAAHDAVLHTASVLSILLLLVTIAALIGAFLKGGPEMEEMIGSLKGSPIIKAERQFWTLPGILAVVTAVIFLLLTPLSAALWRYAPELNFLQFPWRFLAILATICCLALALTFRRGSFPTWAWVISTLVLPAILTTGAYRGFQQSCDDDDTPAGQLSLFRSAVGVEPTDEYTPITADNDSLRSGNAAFSLIPIDPEGSGGVASSVGQRGPAPLHLDINLSVPEVLILNRRDFPTLEILRNGREIPTHVARDDGLVAVTLPAGRSHIDLRERSSSDRIAGNVISCVSLLLLMPFAKVTRRPA